MSRNRRPVAGAYARAVERDWSELCGRAVILSPRDWALIDDWYQRGIPLQIVREAIEAAAERRKRSPAAGPPRGLGYIARAVEESWQVVVDGRSGDPPERPADGAAKPRPIDGWRDCLGREAADTPLRRLLEELVRAHESGTDPAELDERLDREIAAACPGLRGPVQAEVAAELKPYEDRMTVETLESTRRRVVARRLRLRLGLPGLADGAGEAS